MNGRFFWITVKDTFDHCDSKKWLFYYNGDSDANQNYIAVYDRKACTRINKEASDGGSITAEEAEFGLTAKRMKMQR